MTLGTEFDRNANGKNRQTKLIIIPFGEKQYTFDSLNLTECSGNGKPVILPRCEAECECFGGWEGEYCERISANGGGDPHLETLDGKRQRFCLATNRSPFLY